jgi:hypothetical protein
MDTTTDGQHAFGRLIRAAIDFYPARAAVRDGEGGDDEEA